MSEVIQTTFELSATALGASWCGQNVLESEKAKMLERHVQKIAEQRPVPTSVVVKLIDRSNPSIDGVEFSWVTEL